jgi:hypothetical protein
MYPHKVWLSLTTILLSSCFHLQVFAQRKPPVGGRVAVVVDERLSALRATPQLSGKLIRRVGRGRFVAVKGMKSNDGVVFYRVSLSSRTHGWMQREAIVSATQPGDDKRLLSLILSSSDFDRITRARIFLELFPRSKVRPQVLLLLGDSAEEAAVKLTRDAARRLIPPKESFAPEFSYYLNYTGLDRYNRQNIRFTFDSTTKQFHYDGAAWLELIRRYPLSPEAAIAKQRLVALLRVSNSSQYRSQ